MPHQTDNKKKFSQETPVPLDLPANGRPGNLPIGHENTSIFSGVIEINLDPDSRARSMSAHS
jgi:hypothetical protein